jgi:hypothetical protein
MKDVRALYLTMSVKACAYIDTIKRHLSGMAACENAAKIGEGKKHGDRI